MICPYCKETILEGAIKCKHCGSTLDAGFPPNGAGGESELRAFLGPNAEFYLVSFRSFTVAGREIFAATWNWPAFCFSFIWMLYRKMYLLALVTFLFFCIPGANLLLHLATGLLGNYLYYRHVRSKVAEIKSYHPQDLTAALAQVGGVHNWAVPVGIALAAIVIVTFALFFATISTFILGGLH